MSLQIGEVAKLAKVSVKTLHHYDAIGLLTPTGRTDAGYRLYSMADLVRLQQILFYRELEFSLDDIHALMTDPDFNYLTALKQQKVQLQEKQDKLVDVIGLIDKMITSKEEDRVMNLEDMFEVFPEIDNHTLEEQERRWGHTEQHRESMRRARHYTRDDWEALKADSDTAYRTVAALLEEGASTDDERVMDAVDQLRLLIDKWHFPCSTEFHMRLTEMTSADEQYRKNIDVYAPGLAQFIHAAAKAIHARATA